MQVLHIADSTNPTGNYMFKVDNRNTRTRCEICFKVNNKTMSHFNASIIYC